jgi:predicted DNA-binding ribbon-helix-helix protein
MALEGSIKVRRCINECSELHGEITNLTTFLALHTMHIMLTMQCYKH